MDTKKLPTIGAAILAGAIGGFAGIKLGDAPAVVEFTTPPELLSHVTPECAAELRLLPNAEQGISCALGETTLGSDAGPSEVMICNEAVLNPWLRKCVEGAGL